MSLRTLAFAPHSLRRTLGAVALVVGCLIGNAASAGQIISLSTPAGLNPGDTFRFAFVTAGTINAASSDINVYNTFVNTESAGATYGGAVISWKAIGSTATVNARDNAGGFNTTDPVYLVDGTRIANDLTTSVLSGGFWSGQLIGTTKLNLTIDGTVVSNQKAWTGSLNNGMADTGYELGPLDAQDDVTAGSTALNKDFLWWYGEQAYTARNMFAMSSSLTVPSAVPEIDPAGMGSVLALVTGALGLIERRRLKAKLA